MYVLTWLVSPSRRVCVDQLSSLCAVAVYRIAQRRLERNVWVGAREVLNERVSEREWCDDAQETDALNSAVRWPGNSMLALV